MLAKEVVEVSVLKELITGWHAHRSGASASLVLREKVHIIDLATFVKSWMNMIFIVVPVSVIGVAETPERVLEETLGGVLHHHVSAAHAAHKEGFEGGRMLVFVLFMFIEAAV